MLSAVLGALAFGAVLCLWFPAVLTTPALRDVYPMEIVRTTIKITLGVAFVLGVLSVFLKRRKALGLTGAGLALLATLMGGSEVAVATPVARSNHVGLDWFLLDLFLLSAIFVPIELLFGRLRQQPIFRPEWRTDLWHFGVSHLLVQLTVFLTMAPAAIFFRWAVAPELQAAVAAQPLVLQFVEVLVVADLTQYTVHRLFHQVPWLWRFHAIHHSSRHDGLAGRLAPAPGGHRGDARALLRAALRAGLRAGRRSSPTCSSCPSRPCSSTPTCAGASGRCAALLATPQYHHWHHAVEPVDVNFAVHLPVIDRVFGTHYLPRDRWPERVRSRGPAGAAPATGASSRIPFRRAR